MNTRIGIASFGVAVASAVLISRLEMEYGIATPLWAVGLLFLAFLVTSLADFQTEFRGHGVSLTLSEVPLAFGLLFFAVPVTAGVWVAGELMTNHARYRLPWYKHAFNSASRLAHVALTGSLLTQLELDFARWQDGAVFAAAVFGGGIIVQAALNLVVAYATSRPLPAAFGQLAIQSIFLLVGTVLGVLAAILATVDAFFAVPVLFLMIAFWLIGRQHMRARQDYRDLEEAHRFAALIGTFEDGRLVQDGLAEITNMMRATWGRFSDDVNNQVVIHGDVPQHTQYGDVSTATLLETPLEGVGAVVAAPVPGIGSLFVGGRFGMTSRFTRRDTARLAAVAGSFGNAKQRADLNLRLAHEATHDSLTDLLSRTGFTRRVDQLLEQSVSGAMIVVEMARFKEVNATLGFKAGDLLLIEAGQRIARLAGSTAVAARLGGDSFAVFVHDVERKDVVDIAALLREGLSESFVIEQVGLSLGSRIGIAFADRHAEKAEELIRAADVAVEQAKNHQPNVAVYQRSTDVRSESRLEMIHHLKRALGNDDFDVAYQPKVHAVSGKLVGAEALLRWAPDGKPVSPAVFIPYAEAGGLMADITDYIVDHSLRALTEWRSKGIELGVAVNLSAAVLNDDGLPARINGALRRHKIPAPLLTLEITESVMVSDQVNIRTVLTELRKLKIRLSVDDFGTGYSSLQYLKDLDVDELKLDRSFVQDLCVSDRAETIAKAVIDMGHNLGLQVVGEGIETPDTRRMLTNMGCDVIQGFFVARPMPTNQFQVWVDRYSPERLLAD